MKRLIPLSILAFAVSCGQTPTRYSAYSSHSSKNKPYVYEHDTPEEALDATANASVSCFGDDCHDSVAMLVTATGSTVSQCTGFLISPTLLMTNSHCIAPRFKQTPEACSDLKVLFPETARHKGEKAACSKVLIASEIEAQNQITLDYALIRLDRAVERPVLKPSRKGVADAKEELVVYKVNPSAGITPTGWMQKIKCTPVLRSRLLPSHKDATSPIALLGDCDVRPGNSGSPLVDAEGRVRGVVFAQVKEELLRLLKTISGTTMASMAMANNWACLTNPALEEVEGSVTDICPTKTAIPLEKVSGESLLTPQELQEQQKKIVAYNEAVNAWLETPPTDRFEWQTTIVKDENTSSVAFGMSPKCLKRDLTWLDTYAWINIGFIKMYKDKAEMNFEVPTLVLKQHLDRFARVEAYTVEEKKPLNLTFFPDELSRDSSQAVLGVNDLSSHDRNWITDMFSTKQVSLPKCPDAKAEAQTK